MIRYASTSDELDPWFRMAKAQASDGDLADYDRPRSMASCLRRYRQWKLPHVGLFWQRILEEFPRCEHAFPIPGTGFIDPSVGLPIPRAWLINDADDRLVQLQPGRFLFNWRRREGAGPYPRYETLCSRFFELLQEFQSFVAEKRLGEIEISECELTYINHVLEQEGWQFPADIGRVIEHLSWKKERYRFLPQPSPLAWQAKFEFPEGPGALLVKLSPAKHTKDGRDLLALELSARGLPAEASLDSMRHWFSHGHRWIVRGFEDLTSDEAQRALWGKHAPR